MRQLLFLGTGNGMPIASSCTSMLLEDDHTNLLLDAMGGHEILVRFHEAQHDPAALQNIFISHYDSDHILGIVPLIRVFSKAPTEAKRRIFCSAVTKEAIDSLFTFVAKRHYHLAQQYIEFVIVQDGDTHTLGDWQATFFDLKSTKTHQMGISLRFADGKKLTFLGDEPLQKHNEAIAMHSDILLHEAFCLDDQKISSSPTRSTTGRSRRPRKMLLASVRKL